MHMLEREDIMVDMKDQACIAGTEKQMKEQLFLSMELILPLMKLLIQITIVVYCLGNYFNICLLVFSCSLI